MKNISLLITLFTLLSAVPIVEAAQLGYCTDDISRNYIFRMGSSETQGMAIRLDQEKISLLKGKTISGVSAAFGSSRTTDGLVNFFIATSLDADPVYVQTEKISGAVKWLDYTFDTPYVISGDEPALYIGYTAEISTKSSMLMADHSAEVQGCSYVYSDGEWIDTYGIGCGNVSLRCNIPDCGQFTDAMIKPLEVNGYFRAGTLYTLNGQIFNFGTDPITSFVINAAIGSGEAVQTVYDGVNIPQNCTFDFSLPEFMSDTEGLLPLTVEIAQVNNTAELSVGDNTYATDMYFYPDAMERSVLIEGFTGQMCTNCPSGHATLESFVQTVDIPVVEVMHHSGYTPDFMTMDADMDYTYYFGSASTYAPAVMLNRTCVPTIGTCPVMNVTASNLQAAYTHIIGAEPYVSLGIESEYDPQTRCVDVKVDVLTHNNMPADINVINVMLVQNGVVGYQRPVGTDYVHDAVFRGVVTGNSWGVILPQQACVSGGKETWSTSFVLPEGIFSDYYDPSCMTAEELAAYTIPAVAENMYLVAYVGAFDADDVNGHNIYNAVSAPIGASYTQGGMAKIDDITVLTDDEISVKVSDRHIYVNTEMQSVELFTLAGHKADIQHELTPGVYILRVALKDKVISKKILIK